MSGSEFTEVLKPHYNDAVNYCRALCSGSTKAEAEEVMQQSLIKAYENIHKLRERDKFKSWFFQIITRSFYDAVRKPFWSRFVSLNDDTAGNDVLFFEDEYFEDNQQLVGALSKINEKERAAILLFEIGGFSIKEITRIQNENSESAVKSRLSRTREKLKEFMEQADRLPGATPRPLNGKSTVKTNDLYHETSAIIKKINSVG